MPKQHPTADELVATLRQSQIPTVVVEGKDDTLIYQWLEERLGTLKASFLPPVGRNNLLSVYERRIEFTHVPVVFVADRDMWLFSEIPQRYNGIIWTQGYSIENDLYSGAELERLLDGNESLEHQQVLESIIEWFAFEVEEFLAGKSPQVDRHCNEVVHFGQTEMDESFRTSRGFRIPNDELVREIRDTYQLQLRGKLLFQMLVRFLSASNRRVKHRLFGLYEIAFKMPDFHPLMNRLIQGIERKIAAQRSAS